MKSLGNKFRFKGESKVPDLFKFIKPLLVPGPVFELDEKYERVIFELEQPSIILFDIDDSMLREFA